MEIAVLLPKLEPALLCLLRIVLFGKFGSHANTYTQKTWVIPVGLTGKSWWKDRESADEVQAGWGREACRGRLLMSIRRRHFSLSHSWNKALDKFDMCDSNEPVKKAGVSDSVPRPKSDSRAVQYRAGRRNMVPAPVA